ncbi:MAG: Sec-independent protein translocase protein TatB [Thiolinea sp.]
MFDAGFLEMLLIGVVALLVIGPERLPGIAAKAGRMVGKARAFVAATRSDIERELKTEEMRNLLNQQEKEIRELRDLMQGQTDNVRRELDGAQKSFRDSSQQVSSSVSKALKDTSTAPSSASSTSSSADPDQKS